MQLAFEQDDARQRIVGAFAWAPNIRAAAGFIHGGIIAMVLDEVMSKVSRFSDVAPSRRSCRRIPEADPVERGNCASKVLRGGAKGRQLLSWKARFATRPGLLARARAVLWIIDPERFTE